MVSIEKEEEGIERIRQNVPFDIKIENRSASQALPELNWQKRHILWLDYDDPLSPEMLLDSRMVATHCPSGTVLAVSFNCHRAQELDEVKEGDQGIEAIDLFRDRFGRERISNDVSEDDLYGWPFGKIGRKLITNEIESALAVRNIDASDPMSFYSICEIEYQDGAKMTTIAGIFVSDSDAEKLFSCSFDSLDFLVEGGGPIRISVPKLTVREIRKLERQLPLAAGSEIVCGWVPETDARKFVELYRYLPNFAILEG